MWKNVEKDKLGRSGESRLKLLLLGNGYHYALLAGTLRKHPKAVVYEEGVDGSILSGADSTEELRILLDLMGLEVDLGGGMDEHGFRLDGKRLAAKAVRLREKKWGK